MLSEVDPASGLIELYNSSTQASELSGWSLRVVGENSVVLPNDATVAPHGFYLVDPVSLALPMNGATLQLVQPDGLVVDALHYSFVPKELSISRYPVHGGGWEIGTPRTPSDWNLAALRPSVTPATTPEITPTIRPSTIAAGFPDMGRSLSPYLWMLPLLLLLIALGWLGRGSRIKAPSIEEPPNL